MAASSASKLKVPYLPPAETSDEYSGYSRHQATPDTVQGGNTLGALRGLRFALLLEVVTGIFAYEIWRLIRG